MPETMNPMFRERIVIPAQAGIQHYVARVQPVLAWPTVKLDSRLRGYDRQTGFSKGSSRKKGSGLFCQDGPPGAAHKRDLTPFFAGVTLLELLVVIVLLSILAAVAIPTVVPAVEERQMREAARGLSTFLAGARARAVRNGRPVGVRFEPISATSNQASLEMFIVEVPPPFGGHTTGDTATLSDTSSPQDGIADSVSFNPALPTGIVRGGDLVRVNYQGNLYKLSGNPSNFLAGSSFTVTLESGTGAFPPNDVTGPFQIKRQPVRSSAAPYQMPGNAAVDLSHSVGAPTVGPITVMFSPNGGVSAVIDASGASNPPTGTILLLVGKTELVGDAANMSDQTNFQVAIGHKTGQVVSDTVGFAADFQGAAGQ